MDKVQEHQPNADTQALLDQLFVKVNALNTVGEDDDSDEAAIVPRNITNVADTEAEAIHDLWQSFQSEFPETGGTVYWCQLPSLMKIDGQYFAKMRLVVVYEGDQ
ncbi:MAG: hypothetical protein RIA64_01390 [Rhodospirillales bacterium]